VRVQLNAAAILQMAMYALLLRRMVKGQVGNVWVLSLCLTGGCVFHLFETYMGRMDLSFDPFRMVPEWVGLAAPALGIGLAGVVVSLLISKRWRREAS